jgi:uncharacterized membrane protein
MLAEAQSIGLLIVSALMIVVLIRILMIVHHQSGKVKDLEMRMRAMEKLDDEQAAKTDMKNDETEE